MIKLFGKKRSNKELDAIEREAVKAHQKNITNITKTRQNVDKLNVVLKQNNIVFQLAHVIGHQK